MGLFRMLLGEEPGILDTLLNYENAGQFGEYSTEFALTHHNLEGYLKTVRNVYLQNGAKTAETDVIMVHEKGIFAFEIKNYSGWIFGSSARRQWAQCFPNGEKHYFYNPVMQNETHIKVLSNYLGIPAERILSYIVFADRCELKQIPDDTQMCRIVSWRYLLRSVRNDLKVRQTLYTQTQVDDMAARLEKKAEVTDAQKLQHIEEIKACTEGTTCPLCGGLLVSRTGKYGPFFGCSNYPRCHYTRQIKR